jgi:ketosteroid isomerase-like protein
MSRRHRRHDHDHLLHAPEARPASAIGANARGSTAFGAVAGGALAIGAAAIGRLAIGRLAIKRAKVQRLEIDELVVNRVQGPAGTGAAAGLAQAGGAADSAGAGAGGAGTGSAGAGGVGTGGVGTGATGGAAGAGTGGEAALRDRAERWVAAYEQAWRTAGTDAVAELFAEESTYSTGPFQPDLSGLDEIAVFWDADRDGPDEPFTMTSELVTAAGDVAVVRTEVAYERPPRRYRNLWVIRFGADGRAVAFEEWPIAPDGQVDDGPAAADPS